MIWQPLRKDGRHTLGFKRKLENNWSLLERDRLHDRLRPPRRARELTLFRLQRGCGICPLWAATFPHLSSWIDRRILPARLQWPSLRKSPCIQRMVHNAYCNFFNKSTNKPGQISKMLQTTPWHPTCLLCQSLTHSNSHTLLQIPVSFWATRLSLLLQLPSTQIGS